MEWLIARTFFLGLFFAVAVIIPGWARYVVTESLRADAFVNGREFFAAAMAGPRALFFVVALALCTGLYMMSLERFLQKSRFGEQWRVVGVWGIATMLSLPGLAAFLAAFLQADAPIASVAFWSEVGEIVLADDRFGFMGNVAFAVAMIGLGGAFHAFRQWVRRYDPVQAPASVTRHSA